MAERLDSFTFKGRGKPARYPWDQWFDGAPWRLCHPADFTIDVANMRAIVYAAAARNGGTVQTNLDGDSLTIQFTKGG